MGHPFNFESWYFLVPPNGLVSRKNSVTIIYIRFYETLDWGWVGLNVNRIGQKKVIDVMADTCTNTIWRHLNVYLYTKFFIIFVDTRKNTHFGRRSWLLEPSVTKKSHLSEFDFLWCFFLLSKILHNIRKVSPSCKISQDWKLQKLLVAAFDLLGRSIGVNNKFLPRCNFQVVKIHTRVKRGVWHLNKMMWNSSPLSVCNLWYFHQESKNFTISQHSISEI